jgi:hypothetical protein
LPDQGQDFAFDILGGQWADVAKTNAAAGVYDVSLRHTVHPKIDRGRAVAVDANMAERVTEPV